MFNKMNNKWVRMKPSPGNIILNIGDYMQRISNDILHSATHRVSKPRDKRLLAQPRVSFPLNTYLWEDEDIKVLEHIKNPKYADEKVLHFHTKITSKYYGDSYAVQ